MPKYFATVYVIVDVKDADNPWMDAFDYLDELLRPNDSSALSSMDNVNVISSGIASLKPTNRVRATSLRTYANRARRKKLGVTR